ncbi:peptidoglycan-binding protein [Alloactinosynnema sp. L-07]|uniref:peptidoglycan-binding domain-containing protein n=1 Tax=Alloactinosynnema sp. L-07 TaxID=1653480 RepID=UPI0006B69C2F|nr:peptidoglycan-binding protein [Alloactinosynnema sp. L-07]
MAGEILLRTGSTESDWVTYLQQLLRSEGYWDGEDTGVFDDALDAAVRNYQTAMNMQVDGVVGRQTWGGLRDHVSLEPGPPDPADGTGDGDGDQAGWQAGEVDHGVVHITQQSEATCWAAAIAMIINYRDGSDFDDHTLCDHVGLDRDGATVAEVDQALAQVDMHLIAPACFTPDGWLQLLDNGPKGVIVPGAPWHRIVIAGAKTDGTPEGTWLHVLDPAGGDSWQSYEDVEEQFEAGAPRSNNIFGY